MLNKLELYKNKKAHFVTFNLIPNKMLINN